MDRQTGRPRRPAVIISGPVGLCMALHAFFFIPSVTSTCLPGMEGASCHFLEDFCHYRPERWGRSSTYNQAQIDTSTFNYGSLVSPVLCSTGWQPHCLTFDYEFRGWKDPLANLSVVLRVDGRGAKTVWNLADNHPKFFSATVPLQTTADFTVAFRVTRPEWCRPGVGSQVSVTSIRYTASNCDISPPDAHPKGSAHQHTTRPVLVTVRRPAPTTTTPRPPSRTRRPTAVAAVTPENSGGVGGRGSGGRPPTGRKTTEPQTRRTGHRGNNNITPATTTMASPWPAGTATTTTMAVRGREEDSVPYSINSARQTTVPSSGGTVDDPQSSGMGLVIGLLVFVVVVVAVVVFAIAVVARRRPGPWSRIKRGDMATLHTASSARTDPHTDPHTDTLHVSTSNGVTGSARHLSVLCQDVDHYSDISDDYGPTTTTTTTTLPPVYAAVQKPRKTGQQTAKNDNSAVNGNPIKNGNPSLPLASPTDAAPSGVLPLPPTDQYGSLTFNPRQNQPEVQANADTYDAVYHHHVTTSTSQSTDATSTVYSLPAEEYGSLDFHGKGKRNVEREEAGREGEEGEGVKLYDCLQGEDTYNHVPLERKPVVVLDDVYSPLN